MTTLADAAIATVELCPAMRVDLPASMVFGNHAATSAANLAARMQRRVYAPRTAILSSIDLVQLPANTLVTAGQNCIALCNDRFLVEQFPPSIDRNPSNGAWLHTTHLPTRSTDQEVVLVGRYGIATWGHFLAELLPKILLVERAYPGRFSYALPSDIYHPAAPDRIWHSIRQALHACNLQQARIHLITPESNHRFSRLFAVTPIWSDYLMHPHAAEIVRRAFAAIPAGNHQKLAVIRDPGSGRQITNADEIHRLLAAHGFSVQETGARSLTEQIGAFKAAAVVFATLGSDLTNLIFAPPGVQVITAAPDLFGDRFFYALVLGRNGTMMDLRGPVQHLSGIKHKSPFTIAPSLLSTALTRLAPTP